MPLGQSIYASIIYNSFVYKSSSVSAKSEHQLVINNKKQCRISGADQEVLRRGKINSLVLGNTFLEIKACDPFHRFADFQLDPLVVRRYVINDNSFTSSIEKTPAVTRLIKASLI